MKIAFILNAQIYQSFILFIYFFILLRKCFLLKCHKGIVYSLMFSSKRFTVSLFMLFKNLLCHKIWKSAFSLSLSQVSNNLPFIQLLLLMIWLLVAIFLILFLNSFITIATR